MSEQLRFAVRLAQTDLQTLRPGDLMTLRGELDNFLHVSMLPSARRTSFMPMVHLGNRHPWPSEFTVEDFAELQADALVLLDSIVAGRDVGAFSVPPQLPFAGSFGIVPNPKDAPAVPMADGTTRQMFGLVLWVLLGTQPSNAIMRCPDSECRKLFYRVRKQKFCSPQCTNRLYMRQRRENPDVRVKEAEANHTRYRKRLKAKGVTAKPKRRSRSAKGRTR